jgi:hypothetical protein
MTINLDERPPHKKLYQDIFDWVQSVNGLPLESEMNDLLAIIDEHRATTTKPPVKVDVDIIYEAIRAEITRSDPLHDLIAKSHCMATINYLIASGAIGRAG